MGCCDYHEFNLGWFLKQFKEMQDKMDNDFQVALNEFMQQYFNSVMVDAAYNREQERITLETAEESPSFVGNVKEFAIQNALIGVRDEIARPLAEYSKARLPYNGALRNGVYVLIGDSYLAGEGTTTNWGLELMGLLGVESGHYSINAKGGAGFNVEDNSFTELLQASASPTGNNVDVTHVIIGGGYNDDNNYNGLYTAIANFINIAKSQYPNADIYISYIANNISEPYETLGNAMTFYCDGAVRNGAHCISNVYWLLNDTAMFNSDGFHPNATGQKRIAGGLLNGLCGNTVQSARIPSIINFVNPKTGVSNIYSNGTNNWQINGNYTLNSFGLGADLDWTDNWDGSNLHEFCEMTGNYFKGCNGGQTRITVPAIISADGTWYSSPCTIIFKAGVIYLSIMLLRDDKTNFFNGHLSKIIIPGFTLNMDFIKN